MCEKSRYLGQVPVLIYLSRYILPTAKEPFRSYRVKLPLVTTILNH